MQLIRDKVGDKFVIPDNVELAISIQDKFVQRFRSVISENETFIYTATEELDICFGCMAVAPNVKLIKSCDSPECSSCQCRPTWCHSCLGRIFATEQDQENHNNWLSGKAKCPTCRNKFCVLDVRPLRVELPREE